MKFPSEMTLIAANAVTDTVDFLCSDGAVKRYRFSTLMASLAAAADAAAIRTLLSAASASDVSAVAGDVTTLDGDVTTLQGQVAALQGVAPTRLWRGYGASVISDPGVANTPVSVFGATFTGSSGSASIPAAAWAAGRRFRARISGHFGIQASLAAKIVLGGVDVYDPGAYFSVAGAGDIEFEIGCLSVGAAGNIYKLMRGAKQSNIIGAGVPTNATAWSTLDMTSALTVDVKLYWTSTNSNNWARIYNAELWYEG